MGTRNIGGQDVTIVEAFTPKVEKHKLSKKEYARTMSAINNLFHSQYAKDVGKICYAQTDLGEITFKNKGFNDYEIVDVIRLGDLNKEWEA